MKKYIIVFILICLTSCDIMKKSTKDKRETDLEQSNESWRKRKGDTVRFDIPVVRYKDTTIYTVNREGTTLRTVFDQNGNVKNIECMASAIEEMNRNYIRLLEAEKNKTGEKTEEFNTTWILYIFGGFFIVLIVLGSIALTLMNKTLGKHGVLIAQIADKLSK